MPAADLINTIHSKYLAILTELDERGSRRWAAAEAMSIELDRNRVKDGHGTTAIGRVVIQIQSVFKYAYFPWT